MLKHLPAALAVLLVATPSQAGIIFHQDFEDGQVPITAAEGFYSNDANHCCPYSIQNRIDPSAHEGDRVILTTCTADDVSVNGHEHRANLTSSLGGLVNGKEVLPYDTDRWFGFAVFISQESADAVTTTNILNTHTHNWDAPECSSSVTSSPVALRFMGHSYRWLGPELSDPERDDRYQWVLRSHPVNENGADEHGYLLRLDAEQDVGRWVHWVFRMNLSFEAGGPGLLQVWKDGEKIYENFDFNMSTNPIPQHCGHCYPKIGAGTAVIEADEGKTGLPFEVLYDSIRWGDESSNFEEVDPAQDVVVSGGGGAGGADGGVVAGSGGAPSGSGGAGGLQLDDDLEAGWDGASDPGGCSCRLVRRPETGMVRALVLALLGAVAARRRRRSSRSRARRTWMAGPPG